MQHVDTATHVGSNGHDHANGYHPSSVPHGKPAATSLLSDTTRQDRSERGPSLATKEPFMYQQQDRRGGGGMGYQETLRMMRDEMEPVKQGLESLTSMVRALMEDGVKKKDLVDLRAEMQGQIATLTGRYMDKDLVAAEFKLRDAIHEGFKTEMASSREQARSEQLTLAERVKSLEERPQRTLNNAYLIAGIVVGALGGFIGLMSPILGHITFH